jgi:hypothetical protein
MQFFYDAKTTECVTLLQLQFNLKPHTNEPIL